MNQSEYSTKDLYLSVVLKSLNIPILRIENNGRHGIFIFNNSEDVAKIVTAYFNNELKISPRTLFENFKALKSQAYASIGDVR